MKILFDQGTPVPLRQYLTVQSVDTAFEKGWFNLKNGDLLKMAEQDGYEVLITTDQNLRYQQNLANRKLAILVLMTTWPRIRLKVDVIQAAINEVVSGDYKEIQFS